jgi:hypothetical protein
MIEVARASTLMRGTNDIGVQRVNIERKRENTFYLVQRGALK